MSDVETHELALQKKFGAFNTDFGDSIKEYSDTNPDDTVEYAPGKSKRS